MIGFKMTSTYTGKFYGNGHIAGEAPGLVTVAGAPASRQVALIDSVTKAFVARTASASDGTYRFDRLNENRRYMVIAIDHNDVYNAVIRDKITPAT